MDIYDAWTNALKQTRIIRPRVQHLQSHEDTALPYVVLSESELGPGDTVVRTGQVTVTRPSLILPPHSPQFKGFRLNKQQPLDANSLTNLFLVRGIQLPSLNYDHESQSLNIFEGDRQRAAAVHLDQLQRREDVHTGLLSGPGACWQFSVLIYVCTQVARNVGRDIERLMDDYRKNQS